MLISALAMALMQQPCPLTIGVGNDGGIFFDRFHGWYKTGPKMLQSVLHAGCYTDNEPHPITSVKLAIAQLHRVGRCTQQTMNPSGLSANSDHDNHWPNP
jgi:hypothetical protein